MKQLTNRSTFQSIHSPVILLVLSMVYIQSTESDEVNIQPLCAMLLIPILIVMFIKYRQEGLFRLRAAQFDKENESTNFVIRTVLTYQLIADYDVRTAILDDYEEVFVEFKKATRNIDSSTTNSKMFATWLTTALVAGWFVFGGLQVIASQDALPQFLTTISLFSAVGQEIEEVRSRCMQPLQACKQLVVSLSFFLSLFIIPCRPSSTALQKLTFHNCHIAREWTLHIIFIIRIFTRRTNHTRRTSSP